MPIGCVYLRWIMALLSPTRNMRQRITISSENRTKRSEKREREKVIEETRARCTVLTRNFFVLPHCRPKTGRLQRDVFRETSSRELKPRAALLLEAARNILVLRDGAASASFPRFPTIQREREEARNDKDQAKGRTGARQKREPRLEADFVRFARVRFINEFFMPFA